jgi:ribonuclease HII
MLNLNNENKLFKMGYKTIAGVDEAGRGPLAGPVVAACVVFDSNFKLNEKLWEKLTDSKKLLAKDREVLFKIIKENCLAVEIGVVNNKKIDQINILQASFLAMKKAIANLKIKPDYILVDGKFKIPDLNIDQGAICQGDANVFSIAAASIIAKVSRDWLMTEYDKKYPQYNFKQHKGYGTKLHYLKIKENGPCSIHRQSFAPFTKKKVFKKSPVIKPRTF